MSVAVFLGPSLPLDEARRLLPGATYLPPARQADLVSLLDDPPAAIGLIDGEFHQARSVWHKEILLALERGCTSSAPPAWALRAAELERYGMVGVGTVFEQYACGRLTDDDEVALRYSHDDGRYVPLSEPMVNIRATLLAARAAGLPESLCELAEREAKALYYPDRCRRAVLDRLRASGAGPAEVAALDAFWREHPVDAKADDARALLDVLAAFAADPPPPRPPGEPVFRTAGLDTLHDRERRVRVDGREVALADIADAAQLWHRDAATANAAALDRGLVLVLADLLRIEPAEEDVGREIERWRIRHGHTSDDSFAAWLRRNHLDHDGFRDLAAGARAAACCGGGCSTPVTSSAAPGSSSTGCAGTTSTSRGPAPPPRPARPRRSKKSCCSAPTPPPWRASAGCRSTPTSPPGRRRPASTPRAPVARPGQRSEAPMTQINRRQALRAALVAGAAVGAGALAVQPARADDDQAGTLGHHLPPVPGMHGDRRANELWYVYEQDFYLQPSPRSSPPTRPSARSPAAPSRACSTSTGAAGSTAPTRTSSSSGSPPPATRWRCCPACSWACCTATTATAGSTRASTTSARAPATTRGCRTAARST
ncbi:TfuA-like protein [Nonomuraea rubra]|uniref:TfuA-like protein n=1 Tax=Nonomuraea rubra TaxID=46180 RepID=UPI00361B0C1A